MLTPGDEQALEMLGVDEIVALLSGADFILITLPRLLELPMEKRDEVYRLAKAKAASFGLAVGCMPEGFDREDEPFFRKLLQDAAVLKAHLLRAPECHADETVH